MRSVGHVVNQRGDPIQKGAGRNLAFGAVHADKAAHDPAPVGLRLSPKLTDPQHRSEALVGRAHRLGASSIGFVNPGSDPRAAPRPGTAIHAR